MQKYDIIVIGSGIGSLTAAAILARLDKKKVLLLEKHHEIGGFCHQFKRGPYSWDVGVHYVGKKVKISIGEKIFNYITGGSVRWRELEGVFDKVFMPDFEFPIRPHRENFEKDLADMFPSEEKAIKQYFLDLKKARLWFVRNYFSTFVPMSASFVLNQLNKSSEKLALMTTGQYMDKNFKDKKLKSILCARWGDCGVVPEKSAFCMHSIVEEHYMDEAYFPEGGAEKIALQCETVIENFGGEILTNREVTKILVENKAVKGVAVRDVNAPGFEEIIYEAPVVISGAGAYATYNHLLDDSIATEHKEFLKKYRQEESAVILFLGLKKDPSVVGGTYANNWIHGSYDSNELISVNEDGQVQVKSAFLSFSSKKHFNDHSHAAEIIAFMPYSYFEPWRNTDWKQRGNDYEKFKEDISASLVEFVDKAVPGLKEIIDYQELATPLTIEHFSGKHRGSLYGMPVYPEKFYADYIQAKTPVKNLYLCGADACSLGFMGSMLGGFAAASLAGGPLAGFRILAAASKALRKKKTIEEDVAFLDSSPGNKIWSDVVDILKISKDTYRVVLKIPSDLSVLPGQHIKMLVAKEQWRAYSIEKIEEESISILVDLRHQGVGSKYISGLKKGMRARLRLPLTDYIYSSSEKDICFFATSVGISPMIAIMQHLKRTNSEQKLILFFGGKIKDDLFVEPILKPFEDSLNLEVVYCLENPEDSSSAIKGFVHNGFEKKGLKAAEFDHYLCGNIHMVHNTAAFLRKKGATRIFW